MGNNKTENSKKQGKREKIAATPNKWKNQTTEFAGNYEAWQPLTPQKPVGYPEEVLEKLSSLDAKMSGLETLFKQIRSSKHPQHSFQWCWASSQRNQKA